MSLQHWRDRLNLHPLVRGGSRWFERHEAEIQNWSDEYRKALTWLAGCGFVVCVGITVAIAITPVDSEWECYLKPVVVLNLWVFCAHTLWRLFRESVERHFHRNLRHILQDWRWYANYEDLHEVERIEHAKLMARFPDQVVKRKEPRFDEAL
jgi:hypothetical protein